MGLTPSRETDGEPIPMESFLEALTAAGIPWKKVGSNVNADVNGTGHYDHKCNPKKAVYIHSNGSSGTLYRLLKTIGQLDRVRDTLPMVPETPKWKLPSVKEALQLAMPYPPMSFFNSKTYQMRAINHSYHPWVIVARYLDRRGLSLAMLPKGAKVQRYRSGDVDLMIPLANGRKDQWTMHITLLTKHSEKRPEDYLDGDSRYVRGPMKSPHEGAAHLVIPPAISDPSVSPHSVYRSRNDASMHAGYCIGEGLESTLSGSLLSGYPSIFAVNRGGLSLFMNDPGVAERLRQQQSSLYVLVDRDVSGDGQRSARVLIEKAEKHGIPAFYCLPPDTVHGGRKSADWNDALMELGEDSARAAFWESVENAKSARNVIRFDGDTHVSDDTIFAGTPDQPESSTLIQQHHLSS